MLVKMVQVCLLFLFTAKIAFGLSEVDILSLPPPCDNNIYCHGPLLDAVQMASIFTDSKHFVDMKIRHSRNSTLAAFDTLSKKVNAENRTFSKSEIKQFVEENFEDPGREFEKWNPDDWKEHPSFLSKIKDESYRSWGSSLHSLWKDLGRKMIDDVKNNQDLYSIIYVPHPVIVPGGRFREFYYWDSYWILKGLLLSEMTLTAKGILQNFLSIVKEYGFIPNGGRVYYAKRSQPPLLIPMVDMYVNFTGDFKFAEENINTMEMEFNFWITNHTVPIIKDGKTYNLLVYKDSSSGPRPESYREDVITSQYFKDDREKNEHYAELKAAAESGWDFSSRWFISNATNKGNLTNLKARYIVPVDLNSFVYSNAKTLEKYFQRLNNTNKSLYYKKIASELNEAINTVLWHEDLGIWLDYDRLNNVRRPYFYPSNIVPLWAGCYDQTRKDKIVQMIILYFKSNKMEDFKGGIPTSLEQTGEQWDLPNAWPPLQYLVVMGLEATGNVHAMELAREFAENWVISNFKAFHETEAMYEKYDATQVGGHGGGGEYELQTGFGWTNGVIMAFLDKYGNVLKSSEFTSNAEELNEIKTDSTTERGVLAPAHQLSSGSRPLLTGLLALIISITVGFIGVIIYKNRCGNQEVWSRTSLGHSKARYTELRNMPKHSGSFKTSTGNVRSLR